MAARWAPLYFAAAVPPRAVLSRCGDRILMANIASQEKRIQRSERERTENRRRTSTVKTYFRRLEQAVASGDSEAIEAEHRALVSKIDKAAEHGALHANNAARKKSRAARIRAGAGQG
jgi:small subunit ribosomal protein S20